MINKKTKIKIMAQLLIITSVFGIMTGYSFVINEHIQVNALYNTANITIGSLKAISCGNGQTMFIKNDGTVWATGNNTYGQLGIGNITNPSSPVQISISDVKEIVCSTTYTIFIKNDGTVWGTGKNTNGQLGIGNTTQQSSPVQIPIDNVKNVICGNGHTIFIKNDGTVWATGNNSGGQLGIGNTFNKLSPVQIPIDNVKNVICGYVYTMFLKNDGSVWATGSNNSGELGIGGSGTNKLSPVQVPIADVKDFSCGSNHTVFIKSDGSVWATGQNVYGTLGIGNTTDQHLPVQISIDNVKTIICGNGHTMFLKNDGSVWATGWNNSGELGTGNKITQLSPIQVPITDVKDVICGSYHTIFVKNDGTIWNTLSDNYEQLGISNASYLIDATTKVTNAETTKTQANIDIAQTAINLLPTGTDKTNLQAKLDVVKNYMAYPVQLATATNAVIKAEMSKLQTDVDFAKTLVVALLDGTSKTDLTNRLNVVQTEIDKSKQDALNLTDAITKVTEAELTKIQIDIDTAQIAINKLSDGTDKANLQNRLDAIKTNLDFQTLTEATNAVVKAEASKTQEDVDSARTLVNTLQDGTSKTDLTNRLNVVQSEIDKAKQDVLNAQLIADAQTKVATVESNKTQINIDIAQNAIDKLVTGTDKTNLQVRLDKIKDDLNNQTQANADLLDAQTKVTKAESTKTQSDIDIAQNAINKLATGTDKTDLQARLDKVKTDLISGNTKLTDATNAVTQASGTKTQADVDIAKTLVNTLPNGTEKTDLANKLKEIQAEIDKANQDTLNARLLADAQIKVTTAESTKTLTDINIAQSAINKLSRGIDKTNLQNRLDSILIDNAKLLITTADGAKTDINILKAQNAINKLPSGTDKTDLQGRLDTIKKTIADKQAEDAKQAVIDNTTALVETAEKTKTDIDILKAQNAVNKLPVGTDRTDLQNRLDSIKQQKAKDEELTIAIKEATTKTKIAEAYVTNSKASEYIATAQTVIDKLPSGADKKALQESIDKLKVQIANTANSALTSQAKTLVKQAELMKKKSYFTNAWAVVNKMTTSLEKTNFMNRLKALGSDMEIK